VCVSYCCCDNLVWTRSLLSSHISLDMFIVVSYVILLLACFWCRSCLKHHNLKTEAVSCCQMYIYIWHSCSGYYDKNVSLAWQLTWWCDTTGVINLHIIACKDSTFRFILPDTKSGRGYRSYVMWCCIIGWVFSDISFITTLGTTHPKLVSYTRRQES